MDREAAFRNFASHFAGSQMVSVCCSLFIPSAAFSLIGAPVLVCQSPFRVYTVVRKHERSRGERGPALTYGPYWHRVINGTTGNVDYVPLATDQVHGRTRVEFLSKLQKLLEARFKLKSQETLEIGTFVEGAVGRLPDGIQVSGAVATAYALALLHHFGHVSPEDIREFGRSNPNTLEDAAEKFQEVFYLAVELHDFMIHASSGAEIYAALTRADHWPIYYKAQMDGNKAAGFDACVVPVDHSDMDDPFDIVVRETDSNKETRDAVDRIKSLEPDSIQFWKETTTGIMNLVFQSLKSLIETKRNGKDVSAAFEAFYPKVNLAWHINKVLLNTPDNLTYLDFRIPGKSDRWINFAVFCPDYGLEPPTGVITEHTRGFPKNANGLRLTRDRDGVAQGPFIMSLRQPDESGNIELDGRPPNTALALPMWEQELIESLKEVGPVPVQESRWQIYLPSSPFPIAISDMHVATLRSLIQEDRFDIFVDAHTPTVYRGATETGMRDGVPVSMLCLLLQRVDTGWPRQEFVKALAKLNSCREDDVEDRYHQSIRQIRTMFGMIKPYLKVRGVVVVQRHLRTCVLEMTQA
ncbi:MAG: hypothetical protein HW389_768 [Bacteroidetes bacterium]|nr:hypothetical protein [Bacteroidota bacterium]